MTAHTCMGVWAMTASLEFKIGICLRKEYNGWVVHMATQCSEKYQMINYSNSNLNRNPRKRDLWVKHQVKSCVSRFRVCFTSDHTQYHWWMWTPNSDVTVHWHTLECTLHHCSMVRSYTSGGQQKQDSAVAGQSGTLQTDFGIGLRYVLLLLVKKMYIMEYLIFLTF